MTHSEKEFLISLLSKIKCSHKKFGHWNLIRHFSSHNQTISNVDKQSFQSIHPCRSIGTRIHQRLYTKCVFVEKKLFNLHSSHQDFLSLLTCRQYDLAFLIQSQSRRQTTLSNTAVKQGEIKQIPTKEDVKKVIEKRRIERMNKEKTIRTVVWKALIEYIVSSTLGKSVSGLIREIQYKLELDHGITCHRMPLARLLIYLQRVQRNFYWKDMDRVTRNAIEERRRFWIQKAIEAMGSKSTFTQPLIPKGNSLKSNEITHSKDSKLHSMHGSDSFTKLLLEREPSTLSDESLLQRDSIINSNAKKLNERLYSEIFYNSKKEEFVNIITKELRTTFNIPARRIDIVRILKFYQDFIVNDNEELIETMIRSNFVQHRKWNLVLPSVRKELLSKYFYSRKQIFESEHHFKALLKKVKSSRENSCSFVEARKKLLELPFEDRNLKTLKVKLLQEFAHIPYDSRLEKLISFITHDKYIFELLQNRSSTSVYEQLKKENVNVSKHYIALLESEMKAT